MNREAVAMKVPVYSFFRGPMGAVDRLLAGEGRLVFIDSVNDIRRKLVVQPRQRPATVALGSSPALSTIVDHLTSLAAGGISRHGARSVC
jgi:predicted glycosyltransferase